jgi:hypothetical protein
MTVELFSNLLWLALSSLLVGFLLLHWNRWTDESSRSGVGVQLIAVLLLIVVLLPVVSLTDDLQACTMPAESEHLSRRGDLQVIADLHLHAVAVLITGWALFTPTPRAQTLAQLSVPTKSDAACAGYLRILGIRPPPAV